LTAHTLTNQFSINHLRKLLINQSAPLVTKTVRIANFTEQVKRLRPPEKIAKTNTIAQQLVNVIEV
jgi:hypothetical protein